jgi:hypothetical protein
MDWIKRSRGTGGGETGRLGQEKQEDWSKGNKGSGPGRAGGLGQGEQELDEWGQADWAISSRD